MDKVSDLVIYKQYVEFIYYSNIILKKYPKSERHALVVEISKTIYEGMKNIIWVFKLYNKNDKLKILNEMDVNLKYLKVLIRVSYKNKYINNNNYSAWSKKIKNIASLLGGWINSCLKQ